jgi:hypothetical protein
MAAPVAARPMAPPRLKDKTMPSGLAGGMAPVTPPGTMMAAQDLAPRPPRRAAPVADPRPLRQRRLDDFDQMDPMRDIYHTGYRMGD